MRGYYNSPRGYYDYTREYYGSYQDVEDIEVLLRLRPVYWKASYIFHEYVVFEHEVNKSVKIYLSLRPDREPTPLKELYFFMLSFGSGGADEDRDSRDDRFFYRSDAPAEVKNKEQIATKMTYDLLRDNTAERDVLAHISKIDQKLMRCMAGMNESPWSMAFNLHVDEGVVIHSHAYRGLMSVKIGDHFEDLYYNTMPDKLLYTQHPETGEYTIPEGIHITKITVNKQ